MTAINNDGVRAVSAAMVVIDSRNLAADRAAIMITLERAIAAVLLAVTDNDPGLAVGVLNDGLVSGVEGRLVMFAAKRARG